MALMDVGRRPESEFGESNRDKIRAYFATNLNQKSSHVIATYDKAGAVMTLEPVLDDDGTPLLMPSRLRVCQEEGGGVQDSLSIARERANEGLRAGGVSLREGTSGVDVGSDGATIVAASRVKLWALNEGTDHWPPVPLALARQLVSDHPLRIRSDAVKRGKSGARLETYRDVRTVGEYLKRTGYDDLRNDMAKRIVDVAGVFYDLRSKRFYDVYQHPESMPVCLPGCWLPMELMRRRCR